ncbi:hypothetical protein, partial [Streptomyces sp. NPDC000618]|uniref:hypothetical protein n=1 Tax=Streptomyces sp. NPDC000618 TaxID=3154265 RepID=UPI003332DAD9
MEWIDEQHTAEPVRVLDIIDGDEGAARARSWPRCRAGGFGHRPGTAALRRSLSLTASAPAQAWPEG